MGESVPSWLRSTPQSASKNDRFVATAECAEGNKRGWAAITHGKEENQDTKSRKQKGEN